MKLILLLSGPVAVGKTGVAGSLIANHNFKSIKSSSHLRLVAGRENLEPNRTNLQQIGDRLDIQTDYRWLIDSVAKPSIDNAPTQQYWLVDSVRKQRQVQHFREYFEGSVLHVHLIAPEPVIERRYNSRLKAGEESGGISYEAAIEHENEISSRGLISIADLKIDLESIDSEKAALLILEEWNKRKGNAPIRSS